MLSTIVYILGDGVQYRFLRDLAELQIQRTATDELRQSMHIVCGMTEKTEQTENIFFSERVPQGMKLYFLNDLQTAAWLHQSVIDIPEPDMIHVLLESPFRKKDWLERLRLLDRRAAAPVDAVLCDTQRAGLQTDTSSWKDDYRAGRQEIERLGIPVQSYVLQTVPEWLFTAVPDIPAESAEFRRTAQTDGCSRQLDRIYHVCAGAPDFDHAGCIETRLLPTV